MTFSKLLVATALTLTASSSMALAACTDPPTSRYVAKGDTVYDTVTDLTWQRCSVGQTFKGGDCVGNVKKMPWADAMQQAKGDWHVATKEQLLGLVSPTCKGPAINTEVFPDHDDQPHFYWSSTEYGVAYAAYVGFNGGGSYNGERPNQYAVRLVKKGK